MWEVVKARRNDGTRRGRRKGGKQESFSPQGVEEGNEENEGERE